MNVKRERKAGSSVKRELTGSGVQAEGEFAPGRDGRGSRRGGGGVGAGGRRSGRHGEATVPGDLAEDLTARSLGPQGADLDGRGEKINK